MIKIAIIGGGPAGMMAAAKISDGNKDVDVFLIEKNVNLGRKLLLTGGGRCNLTTGIENINEVLENYPRGKQFLKFAMHEFSPSKVCEFFENNGVPLKVEKDFRVFPKSDKGTDIVKVFENIFSKNGVNVLTNHNVEKIDKKEDKFIISFIDKSSLEVDTLILTTGGQAYSGTGSRGDGYKFAEELGHKITKLAPSLSSFIVREDWPIKLAGVAFEKARLKFFGSKKYEALGPFLFTHKGLTGPAVFSLSSLSAYENFGEPVKLFIDFFPDCSYEELFLKFREEISKHPKKSFENTLGIFVPKSFAKIICSGLKIGEEKLNNEFKKSDLNRVIEWIKNASINVIGKSSGEEFVTAGGIDLSEVNSKTMESKICPNLYFAGEILDVDGFTGGFNLQAAWATGHVAGKSCIN